MIIFNYEVKPAALFAYFSSPQTIVKTSGIFAYFSSPQTIVFTMI